MHIKYLLILNALLFFSFFVKKDTPSTDAPPSPSITVGPQMLCDGTLGDNIFTDGDFGSGTTTNLPSDPFGYAPGYLYQPNPPPNDGYYTLTNNTSAWGTFAQSSWVNTDDNSSDPNGYMMVINASYEPGIFYENTIDNLCENTVYQFSADIINLIKPGLGAIQPNLSFHIDGVNHFSTGQIPEDGSWNTYGFTFTTGPGVTTLDLSIRNNAPGGNGNDLALDNISFRACGPEININTSIPIICDGETASLIAEFVGDQYDTPVYQWQRSTDDGATWNDILGATDESLFLGIPVNDYQYRLVVANAPANLSNSKCRVISNVEIIEITPIYFTHYDTLCQGLTLQVGTSNYTQSGTYLDSLIASYGCDSIVTTHLEIVPDIGITADFEIINPSCTGDSDGAIIISNVQNGSGNYSYALDGGDFQDTPWFENLGLGVYDIQILDHYGCELQNIVELSAPLQLTVQLNEDVSILLGDSHPLQPSLNVPIDTFFWNPTNGLDCGDCLSPTVTPTETTTYQLTAVDPNGCTATDEITIEVDKKRRVYLPNAFSPNGDGYNDYYTVFGGNDVEAIVRLQIFNRWGAVVFSKENFLPNEPLEGWDGYFKGQDIPDGVYIYTAEIRFIDGLVEIFSGDISVVK